MAVNCGFIIEVVVEKGNNELIGDLVVIDDDNDGDDDDIPSNGSMFALIYEHSILANIS